MLLSATTTFDKLVSAGVDGQDRPPGLASRWTERQLRSGYEQLQVELRQPNYRRVLGQPLEVWACATDRGLPIAFLKWPVQKVLEQSFDDLRVYPTIGAKKLAGIVTLLGRVAAGAKTGPETLRSAVLSPASVPVRGDAVAFDAVTDPQWRKWQATVARRGLADEPVGRLVASLQDLPVTLWTTPLREFLAISLLELRGREGFGAKRITAVLQAFHAAQAHRPCLIPRRLAQAEAWLRAQQRRDTPPARETVERGLVLPLLEQIEQDLGSDARFSLELRWGIGTRQRLMAEIAELSGVRLRQTYHKLAACTQVMCLRWPQDAALLRSWLRRVGADPQEPGVKLLRAVASVCFRLRKRDLSSAKTPPAATKRRRSPAAQRSSEMVGSVG